MTTRFMPGKSSLSSINKVMTTNSSSSLPTPVQEPEAHYGLIVKYQNKRPAYFTLEKGDDEQSQFICMPDIRQHSLLKSTEGIRTAEEFAEQVHQLIAQDSRLLKDEHVNAK